MSQENANVIRFAMTMEMDGHNYFKEKAELFKDPTTKSLFEKLAKVELGHYHFLEKELEKYLDDKDNYQVDKDFIENEGTDSIFKNRDKSEKIDISLQESDVPDINILRMAYLIERDFAEFYEEASENADDPALKELFAQLASWEYKHEDIFKTRYKELRKEYMNHPWG